MLFDCPAEIKEIAEIFASLICAQPVPKALSFISFISAGLKKSVSICEICVTFDNTKVQHFEMVLWNYGEIRGDNER